MTDEEIREYATVAHVPQSDAKNLACLVIQIKEELSDALEALSGLCRPTGDETHEEGEAIWTRADQVLAWHDD